MRTIVLGGILGALAVFGCSAANSEDGSGGGAGSGSGGASASGGTGRASLVPGALRPAAAVASVASAPR